MARKRTPESMLLGHPPATAMDEVAALQHGMDVVAALQRDVDAALHHNARSCHHRPHADSPSCFSPSPSRFFFSPSPSSHLPSLLFLLLTLLLTCSPSAFFFSPSPSSYLLLILLTISLSFLLLIFSMFSPAHPLPPSSHYVPLLTCSTSRSFFSPSG